MRAVLCALLAALAARSLAARESLRTPRCILEGCRYTGRDSLERSQYAVNGKKIMIYASVYGAGYLKIYCNGAKVLESSALPCFETALRMMHLELNRCPLPGAASLADLLATLNVTLMYGDENETYDTSRTPTISLSNPPASEVLAAKHFVGLERLVSLEIYGIYTAILAECNFVTPLQSLRSLEIRNVMLLPCDLDVPPSLRRLNLDLYNRTRLPVVPTLEVLSLSGWTEPRPAPLARCNLLRELRLYELAAITLPESWLVNCSRIELLYIVNAPYLITLPPNLLVGMRGLRILSVIKGAFETLPAGILDYSPDLNSLELNNNGLKMLPSGMFNVAWRVQKLDFSWNKLKNSTIDVLAPLVELTELNLEYNTGLGDVCETNGYSLMRNLTNLRKLLLEQTGVTRICRDWREDMIHLETLDLSRMKVTKLSFQDMQFTRTEEAEVILQWLETPVTVVEMTREDYNNGVRGASGRVDVQLNYHYLAPVECDCNMYWTRRVMDLSLSASRLISQLRCTDGGWLRDVPPEEMLCARPDECAAATLPAACTCDARPDNGLDRDRRLVRVRCENASLTHVPHPRALNDSTERLYELLLAHNHIANLTSDDLRHDIKALDLRSNLLQGVDEETAKRLGEFNGTLRLANNPFECDCRATPLLRALHKRLSNIDWNDVTCSNGSALYAVPIENCLQPAAPPEPSLGTWVASGLAVLLALALGVIVCLASRERRYFMLAVLHRWGFKWRVADPEEDEDRRHDAFVTFSHKDEALVPELIARLEPTYQLCVHYRDWIPGRFISEQVVESVRESRRTIALVSRHFLASSWARAEFREAHAAAMLDARPRLIVVLLEEPAALEMDDLLRRYVATHTYLRWGEPWFWDKLSVALPRPRAPRAPDPAPPASPPALALEMLPACNRTITETDASAPAVTGI